MKSADVASLTRSSLEQHRHDWWSSSACFLSIEFNAQWAAIGGQWHTWWYLANDWWVYPTPSAFSSGNRCVSELQRMLWQRIAKSVRCILDIHTRWPLWLDNCRMLTRTKIGKWLRFFNACLSKNKRCSKRIGNLVDPTFSFPRPSLFNRSLAQKVKKMQEALDDRKLAFNALSAKNALLEADITVATQQYQDAQHDLKKLHLEKEQIMQHLRQENKQEKDVRSNSIPRSRGITSTLDNL